MRRPEEQERKPNGHVHGYCDAERPYDVYRNLPMDELIDDADRGSCVQQEEYEHPPRNVVEEGRIGVFVNWSEFGTQDEQAEPHRNDKVGVEQPSVTGMVRELTAEQAREVETEENEVENEKHQRVQPCATEVRTDHAGSESIRASQIHGADNDTPTIGLREVSVLAVYPVSGNPLQGSAQEGILKVQTNQNKEQNALIGWR
jgi:hypothetical protein